MSSEESWAWVFVLGLMVLGFLGVGVAYLKGVRARLLEVLLVPALSSYVSMTIAKEADVRMSLQGGAIAVAAVALVPMLLLLFGAVMGLWWATKLGEERTWRRLGLLALAMLWLPSMGSVAIGAFGVLILTVVKHSDFHFEWLGVGLLLAPLPLVAGGFAVQRKVHKEI